MNRSAPPTRSGASRGPLRLAVGIGALVALAYFVRPAMVALASSLAGVLLAILLDAPVGWLRRRLGIDRALSVAIVLVVMTTTAAGALWAIGTPVISQLVQLAARMPSAVEAARSFFLQVEWGRTLMSYLPGPEEIGRLGPQIVGGITMAFSSTVEALVGIFVALFIGVYLVLEPRLYVEGWLRLLPADRRARWREIATTLGRALRWWLMGRVVSMVAVGALTIGALLLIGVPLPLGLGLLAGLLSFIPYLGPVLAAVPAMLVGLSQAPILVLYVVVAYGGIQLVENYLITPLVQRRLVRLAPVIVIFAQVILGLMFGLVGALLATPIAIVVIVLIQTRYIEDTLGETAEILGERG